MNSNHSTNHETSIYCILPLAIFVLQHMQFHPVLNSLDKVMFNIKDNLRHWNLKPNLKFVR